MSTDYEGDPELFADTIEILDDGDAAAATAWAPALEALKDGQAFWPPESIVKDWPGRQTFSTSTTTRGVYDPLRKRFYIFGPGPSAGANPVGTFSTDANLSSDAAASWTALTLSANDGLTYPRADINPAGVIVMGGKPGSSSTKKIRESSDGTTFTARDTVATGTIAVQCVKWHSGASKFVIGLSNTAATNIETSPDGQTWTQITGLANTNHRRALATNGTVIVAFSGTSTDKCLSSTNVSVWTERTLPFSEHWYGAHWDPAGARFVAVGATHIAVSSDGATWTSGGTHGITFSAASPPDLENSVHGFGRLVLINNTDSGGWGLTYVGSTLTVRKLFDNKFVDSTDFVLMDLIYGDGRFLALDCLNTRAAWTHAGGPL
jgi:hypothetical protein